MTPRWLLLLVAVLALSCGSPAEKTAGTAPPVDRAAVLAEADVADGASDHVVGKCAVCGLGMDGTPEHSTSLAGYTLHFCSAECQETFQRNPDAVLARLAAPRK